MIGRSKTQRTLAERVTALLPLRGGRHAKWTARLARYPDALVLAVVLVAAADKTALARERLSEPL